MLFKATCRGRSLFKVYMEIFEDKKPVEEKLIKYGFEKIGGGFKYTRTICDGQFKLGVTVDSEGKINTQLFDVATGDGYTLHLVDGAVGEFVGGVRKEFERALQDIAQNCFDSAVFSGEILNAVFSYAHEKYNNDPEYLWGNLPDGAVLRRTDTGKWYVLIMNVPKKRLGLQGEGKAEILDVRCDPELIPTLIDGKRFFAAYHMNKKHWITLLADGSISAEQIFEYIDKSYALAKK